MSGSVNNDPDSVRIRKNKSTILLTGAGVAAFGIWSVIKVVMEFVLSPIDEKLATDLIAVGPIGEIFIAIVLIIMIMTDVILRIFIFFCARKESKGYKAKGLMFTSFLLIAGSLGSLVIFLLNAALVDGAGLDFEDMVSLFVEMTSLVITFEMIAATLNNRKLLAKKRREAADAS
ncbi:MAG: hypothetical protein J5786_05080 [Clostridiales bacterium]|nr:hypothetical protein [Clostridiales bacterium]